MTVDHTKIGDISIVTAAKHTREKEPIAMMVMFISTIWYIFQSSLHMVILQLYNALLLHDLKQIIIFVVILISKTDGLAFAPNIANIIIVYLISKYDHIYKCM